VFAGPDLDGAVTAHGLDELVDGPAVVSSIRLEAASAGVARAIDADFTLDPELCLTVLSMGQRWPETSWGLGARHSHIRCRCRGRRTGRSNARFSRPLPELTRHLTGSRHSDYLHICTHTLTLS
jgi:hypothetical protein